MHEDLAEELIGLILDFRDQWPVGSEAIAKGKDADPVDETNPLATLQARSLIWAARDAYNDARDRLLQKLLAQVMVTLGSDRDRTEAIREFRTYLDGEVTRILLPLVKEQAQGPVD